MPVVISTPGTLVFKTTYHPNWHVTIDGIEQPAFMASPSYVGVEVPEGRHEVRAEYRTSPVRTALLILGGATLVAVLVWGITGARWLPALQRRMRAESD